MTLPFILRRVCGISRGLPHAFRQPAPAPLRRPGPGASPQQRWAYTSACERITDLRHACWHLEWTNVALHALHQASVVAALSWVAVSVDQPAAWYGWPAGLAVLLSAAFYLVCAAGRLLWFAALDHWRHAYARHCAILCASLAPGDADRARAACRWLAMYAWYLSTPEQRTRPPYCTTISYGSS